VPKNPKTIATINFKGGVGKTTVTWCLGDVVSSFSNAKVLMFDLDAQMSLTQAIALNEATGALLDKFGTWYETATSRGKTIFHALDQYARPGQHFDFGIGFDFIYQITETFHFIPSVEDLYWTELEISIATASKNSSGVSLAKLRTLPNSLSTTTFSSIAPRRSRSFRTACSHAPTWCSSL